MAQTIPNNTYFGVSEERDKEITEQLVTLLEGLSIADGINNFVSLIKGKELPVNEVAYMAFEIGLITYARAMR